jgi:nucleotide-binding universal stress UspA family protein
VPPIERRILIAMDGSIHAFHAVNYVARNCSPSALGVNLMTVLAAAPEEVFWQVNLGEEFTRTMQEKYARARGECRRAATEALEAGKAILGAAGFRENAVGFILHEWREGVARDIIAEARNGYDAIVIGRRGLGRMDRLLLGSVSNKIVQQVNNIPVWVVGGDIRPRKFLLAVDASENSLKAAEHLAGFAAASGAAVVIFHAVDRSGLGFGPSVIKQHEASEKQLEQKPSDKVQKMLDDCGTLLERAGIKPDRIDIRYKFGSLSRAGDILMEARDSGCGTIVLGRRGISRTREFLMGRVTSKVLNFAEDLAVWIVP